MNYGNIKYFATEDGVGCRTVLFVSGCRHHCEGCFQPQTWDFSYGSNFSEETETAIIESLNNKYVTGLTILGGEPFEPENQTVLLPFVNKVKQTHPDKTIWAYSGYTFEELTTPGSICHTPDTILLLKQLDVLIDGEFVLSEKNLMLPFRGSNNQRVIDIPQSLKDNTVILSQYHNRNR